MSMCEFFVHGVMGSKGRIVFVFDLPLSPHNSATVHLKIQLLVTHVILNTFGHDKASILMKKKVMWDSTIGARELSMHLTIPLWVPNRIVAYKVLYSLINDVAEQDPWFSWLDEQPLIDTARANKNATLRLPYMKKEDGDSAKILKPVNKPVISDLW